MRKIRLRLQIKVQVILNFNHLLLKMMKVISIISVIHVGIEIIGKYMLYLEAVDMSINTRALISADVEEVFPGTEMVITRSLSAELYILEEEESSCEVVEEETTTEERNMAAAIPEPRGIPQTHGCVLYGASSYYDGILPDDIRSISTMPWFSRAAVLEDTQNHL